MNFRRYLKKQLKQLPPERLIVFRAIWRHLEEKFNEPSPPSSRKKSKRELPHRLAWFVLAGALANQVYHWDLVDGEWVIRHHSQMYYVDRNAHLKKYKHSS